MTNQNQAAAPLLRRGLIDGPAAAAQFSYPLGIAVDSTGNIFVGDLGNCVVRKISSLGVVSTFAGSGGCGGQDGSANASTFNGLAAIVIDSTGNLYVADAAGNKIRKILQ